MQHTPKKRFGQNFLQDTHIIERIVKAIAPQKTDQLIEIGPGLGALTEMLLAHTNHLTAIEVDRDLYQTLKTRFDKTKLTLILQDALTVDFSAFQNKLRIVGNLPYNISTPLLFHLFKYTACIKDMHFMLQKEVVNRLAAAPNTKAYGRLSVMTQALCAAEPLLFVPPEAFHPAPKVDSAVVRLTPHQNPPEEKILKSLEAVLQQAFSTRRKTLRNTLKPLCTAETLEHLGINPQHRPENLSVETYLKLAKYFS